MARLITFDRKEYPLQDESYLLNGIAMEIHRILGRGFLEIVLNDIIVEIKAQKGLADEHYNQVLNYLAVSKSKIGLIYNFGESSLVIKRVIL